MGKINEILSDQESMAQIKKLASMMGMGENISETPPPVSPAPQIQAGNDMPDISKILMFSQMAKNMTENDKNTSLLIALKPHLSAERQQKTDKAIKFLKMMNLISFAKNSGILSEFENMI